MGLVATGLFCEDVREEKSGTVSIIGVFSDNIVVPTIPNFMPKLGFYVRTHITFDFDPVPIELQVKRLDGVVTPIGTMDPHIIKQSIADARLQGAPYSTIISQGVAPNFPISQEGRALLSLKYGKNEVVVAHLNFRKTPPETAVLPS